MNNTVTVANGNSNPVPVSVNNFPAPSMSKYASSSSVNRIPVNATASIVLTPNPLRKGFIINVENNVALYVLYATSSEGAASVESTNYTHVIVNPNNELVDTMWQGFVSVVCPLNPGGMIQVSELS